MSNVIFFHLTFVIDIFMKNYGKNHAGAIQSLANRSNVEALEEELMAYKKSEAANISRYQVGK